MTRLFTRHDLERAARLALEQRERFPQADSEVIAVSVAAHVLGDGEDWLPLSTVQDRVLDAYSRGERAAREQQMEVPEIVLHDLLT